MLYPISEPVPDSINNRFGYIDDRGNVAVRPSYLGCSHFFEGKAAVIDDTEKTGFIDAKGRLTIPHQFQGLGRFHDGVCFTCGGYINHFGDWLTPPTFLAAGAFSEGLASASTDAENFGFIDFTGRFVLPPGFQPCKSFSEGLAAVCIDDRWVFIDRAGKLEIPTVFEGPTPKRFRDGIAGVRIDGSWGFIDRSGSFLIKPEYEEVRHFSEGRACVRRNGKWGMIDAVGQQILDCQFDELEPLNAGMAAAKIDGKAGFLSAAAKWFIEPKFDRCLSFFGNLAVVKLGKPIAIFSEMDRLCGPRSRKHSLNIHHRHFLFSSRYRRTVSSWLDFPSRTRPSTLYLRHYLGSMHARSLALLPTGRQE